MECGGLVILKRIRMEGFPVKRAVVLLLICLLLVGLTGCGKRSEGDVYVKNEGMQKAVGVLSNGSEQFLY